MSFAVSLGFCPLGSGSKGNSVFLRTAKTRVLIDAGLSALAIEQRLEELAVDIATIQAILVTHEHIDHIRAIAIFSEKYKIPVFANGETAKGICSVLQMRPRFKIFTTGEPFTFEDLLIDPFSIPHDAFDPVAFIIKIGILKIGFCTDLGHVTSCIRKKLEQCDYLYLEANHQISMVHACNRPMTYKQRVLGKLGHLSNEECASLLEAIAHPGLKHVYLAHLSSECNSPASLFQMIQTVCKKENLLPKLSIALQEKISHPIFF